MEFKHGKVILDEKELRTYRDARNSLVGIGEAELYDRVTLTGDGIIMSDHGLMMGYLSKAVLRGKDAGISRRTRRAANRMVEEYVAAERAGLVETPPVDSEASNES